MRRRWRRAASLVGAWLLALLLAPSLSQAKDGLDLMVRFPGSNGYEITVGGYEATAFIEASRSVGTPRRRAVSSTYVSRAKVTPTRIEADFGSIGHVSLHFQSNGRVVRSKPRRHCLGADHYTIRSGAYVGSARFRGEEGYTTATVHRVPGKEITPRQLVCFGSLDSIFSQPGAGSGPAKARSKVTRLIAGRREALTATYLEAIRQGNVARFRVSTQRSEGQLAVYRTAYARAPASDLSANSSLSSANLSPPPPFSGSGSFERGPQGAKLWTGSLSVSFPGEPHVPLTGPQFKTQLTRSW